MNNTTLIALKAIYKMLGYRVHHLIELEELLGVLVNEQTVETAETTETAEVVPRYRCWHCGDRLFHGMDGFQCHICGNLFCNQHIEVRDGVMICADCLEKKNV